MDDEQLCYRFLKRLRLTDCPEVEDCAAVLSPYDQVNSLLHKLHSEQQLRRSYSSLVVDKEIGDFDPVCDAAVTPTPMVVAETLPMTCFTLADVVHCGHGSGGRCLQCAGRSVQNVPLHVYGTFCRAYGGLLPVAAGPQRCTLSSSSRSAMSPSPAWQAVELTFPAFVSLAWGLAPEPGERLLHLGSGSGQSVLAWALLVPHGAASGVEGCPGFHRAARAAAGRLAADVQRKIHLHHCDPFGVQSDWREASVILVSSAGFDDSAMGRVVEGLQGAEPGTRVVTLSRPLCSAPGRAPPGFVLARQAALRATGPLCNTTVYIYRKLAAH